MNDNYRFELNGKPLTAGERIRLHASLSSDDPFCLPAGERDPEPRHYGNEPAADVQRGTVDDGELSLYEPRLSHETKYDYNTISRPLAYSRQRQAEADRRALLRGIRSGIAVLLLAAGMGMCVAWIMGWV